MFKQSIVANCRCLSHPPAYLMDQVGVITMHPLLAILGGWQFKMILKDLLRTVLRDICCSATLDISIVCTYIWNITAAGSKTNGGWLHLPKLCKKTHSFNGPFSGTTQKGKTNLDFTEARDSDWQWHHWAICKSAPRSRQITMPAPHHCLPPNQQHQSTEGKELCLKIMGKS